MHAVQSTVATMTALPADCASGACPRHRAEQGWRRGSRRRFCCQTRYLFESALAVPSPVNSLNHKPPQQPAMSISSPTPVGSSDGSDSIKVSGVHRQSFLLGVLCGLGLSFTLGSRVRKMLRTGKSTRQKFGHPEFKEEQLLSHVLQHATKGDPASVLAAMDDYGRRMQWHMSIGDEKAKVIVGALREHKPAVAVEMGSYVGYSAVSLASNLPEGGRLVSFEMFPLYAAIATKVVEFAGLADRVSIVSIPAMDALDVLRGLTGQEHLDFLFLDHDKSEYLPLLAKAEALGLFRKGSVVVADNVIYPGAPQYLKLVQTSPKWDTKLVMGTVEYRPDVEDGVAVSVRT